MALVKLDWDNAAPSEKPQVLENISQTWFAKNFNFILETFEVFCGKGP